MPTGRNPPHPDLSAETGKPAVYLVSQLRAELTSLQEDDGLHGLTATSAVRFSAMTNTSLHTSR